MMTQSKDFITHEMSVTKSIGSEQWKVWDDNQKIMEVLSTGPKTVKEIHDEFYDVRRDQHTASLNTIYRWLRKLEKFDLVTVAGYRKIEGERSPEKLYSRTSHLYFPSAYEDAYGEWVTSKTLVEKVANILLEAVDRSEIDMDQFKTIFRKYSKQEFASWRKLIEETEENKKLVEIYRDTPMNNVGEINRYVSMFMVYIKNPEIFEEMAKIFRS